MKLRQKTFRIEIKACVNCIRGNKNIVFCGNCCKAVGPANMSIAVWFMFSLTS